MGAIESSLDIELDDIDINVGLFGSNKNDKNNNNNKSNDDNEKNTRTTMSNNDATSNEKNLEILAEWISNGQAKNIIVLSGAGVSTGAGIPDFRTPGTGLYDNLQKYDLPYPEAIFDIDYYKKKPGAFVSLANELWPGIKFSPTLTHSFLSLLSKKGLLLRNYTQNIDGLEFLAGIPDEKLVECHGHFRTSACVNCGAKADPDWVKKRIVEDGETPICDKCGGHVKPDIVFFGESLPDRFHQLLKKDTKKADLLLVMGTSLQVAPVSHIPHLVKCNRVLFNRDLVMQLRKNDLFVRGDCDSNVKTLCDLLGWTNDLNELHTRSIVGNDNKEEDEGKVDNTNAEESKPKSPTEDDTAETEEGKDPEPEQLVEPVADKEEEDSDDEFAPSTILVVLGSLMFEPSGEADVLSVKIKSPDEMEETLAKAKSDVKPGSVDLLHVILMASAISSMWDDSILSSLSETLQDEAELNIHVMASPHIPVEAGDVDDLRSAIVLNGFMLEQEAMAGDDGSWVLTARKM